MTDGQHQRVAVTGGDGFLGWHVGCALLASGREPVLLGRDAMADTAAAARRLAGCSAAVHLAANGFCQCFVYKTHGNLLVFFTGHRDRGDTRAC